MIESVASSLKTGPTRRQIRAEEPQMLEHLLQILEAQARGEEDELKARKSGGDTMPPGHFHDRRCGRPVDHQARHGHHHDFGPRNKFPRRETIYNIQAGEGRQGMK